MEKDAEDILDCLRSAFQPYARNYTPQAFEDTVLSPETMHRRLEAMSVFVATSSAGEIIGTIACHVIDEETGHIRGMAVRPSWQGCGVAIRLLQSVEAELRAKNCTHVTLDTTEPLKRAVRFYENNGFRPSGKIADYYAMPLVEYIKGLK